MTVFPRVGVESGNRDAGMFRALGLRGFFDKFRNFDDALLGHVRGNVFESDVGGHENDAQFARRLHHGETVGSAEFRNEFGVPGERNSRFIDCRFVDGTGDNRIGFSSQDVFGCADDGVVCELSGFWREFARSQFRKGKGADGDDIRRDFRGEKLRGLADDLCGPVEADIRRRSQFLVPENTHGDFRSDSGGIADRQSYDGFPHVLPLCVFGRKKLRFLLFKKEPDLIGIDRHVTLFLEIVKKTEPVLMIPAALMPFDKIHGDGGSSQFLVIRFFLGKCHNEPPFGLMF